MGLPNGAGGTDGAESACAGPDAASVRAAVAGAAIWTAWLDELPAASLEDTAQLLSAHWSRAISSRIASLQRVPVRAARCMRARRAFWRLLAARAARTDTHSPACPPARLAGSRRAGQHAAAQPRHVHADSLNTAARRRRRCRSTGARDWARTPETFRRGRRYAIAGANICVCMCVCVHSYIYSYVTVTLVEGAGERARKSLRAEGEQSVCAHEHEGVRASVEKDICVCLCACAPGLMRVCVQLRARVERMTACGCASRLSLSWWRPAHAVWG